MSTKTAKWSHNLSVSTTDPIPWVNTAAISDNGKRVVGGTFLHDYTNSKMVQGTYGTFAYDSNGTKLWANTFQGLDGIFAVGISADGHVIAGGGVSTSAKGLLKIYEAHAGAVLFDSTAAGQTGINGRVSGVSLSRTGHVVAAAAGQLYVFVKSGGAYIPVVPGVAVGSPDFATALGRVASVSVHPSGLWLAACNQQGQVLVATIHQHEITKAILWTAPQEPIDPTSSASAKALVPFLCVATSASSDSFVVGGGDVVYRGSLEDRKKGKDPVRYSAWDAAVPAPVGTSGKPKPNVRWLAISGDGETFAAVANRGTAAHGTGQLLLYKADTAEPAAKTALAHNPNGVSMDHAGKIIAVSDGYPVGTAANIYRFDPNGAGVWSYPTPNMNWPVAVSGDGSGIVAGGDDGNLTYFTPGE